MVRDAIKTISSKKLPVEELTDIASAIVDRSDEYDVPTSLVLGVIRQESNFDREAISIAGARGLMQVLPSTANDIQSILGVKTYSPSRPSHNVRFGVFYLARMLHSFEDEEDLALAAYNAGPVLVERVRSGKFGKYPNETEDYIVRVKSWQEMFQKKGITW
jgi:soluble lytic murein transglycosylase-like protein